MLNRFKESLFVIFLFNFLVACILYLPSLHSKFVYDINQHIITYDQLGWQGFWSCWGEKTIHWGINCINFLIWRLAGVNDIVWFIIAMAMHGLVATLLYRLLNLMLDTIPTKHLWGSIVASVFLFLVSPYHSETIVWGATLFYLTFAASFLGIIICFVHYGEKPKWWYLFVLYALYLLQVVSYEEFFIIPFVLAIFYWLWFETGRKVIPLQQFIFKFFLPQIGLILLYFLWNKCRIGTVVGHYGAKAHFNFDPYLITANFTKYLLKFIYVHLFFSYTIRDRIYTLLEQHRVIWLLLTCYSWLAVIVVYLLARRKVTPVWTVILSLAMLYVLSLLPVINLYFPFSKDIEQERYLYTPALFFYPLLVLVLFQLLGRAGYFFISIAIIVSLFFLHRNVYCWEQVGRIYNGLAKGYKWQNARRVFIIANADNYNGAYLLRDMPESAFAEVLYVQRHIDISKNSYDILQYNLLSPTDSCYHEIVDSNTIRLTIAKGGGWLWYKSFGANSYDSTLYQVTVNQWYPSFTVRFKDKQPDDVYIYAIQDRWIEIKDF